MSSGQAETHSEYEGVLSNVFSSRAVSQIMDFFLDHKEFDYSPGEIARKTGLSFRTIFRELPHLEKNQLIYISRRGEQQHFIVISQAFRTISIIYPYLTFLLLSSAEVSFIPKLLMV